MDHPNLRSAETCYVSTYLGNRFDPIVGSIDNIHMEDIAHGLAFQCRFNGQTSEFFSIAQHSLIVADLVPPHLRLAALLHDASEAYLGDVVKPLKALLPNFKEIEHRVEAAIAERFGVQGFGDPLIKRADMISLATEKRDLMPHSTEDWSYLEGIEPLPDPLDPMAPHIAKRVFLIEVSKALRSRG